MLCESSFMGLRPLRTERLSPPCAGTPLLVLSAAASLFAIPGRGGEGGVSGVRHVLSSGVRVEIKHSTGKGRIYGDIQDVRGGAIIVRILDRTDPGKIVPASSVVSLIATCLMETLQMQCTVVSDNGATLILRQPRRVEVVRRKRDYRKRTRLPARYTVGEESCEAREAVVTDLSVGGMQLEMDGEPAVGEKLRIEFSLPDTERPIRVRGEVVRIVPHGAQGFGPKPRVGIRLAAVDRLDLALLRAFVEGGSQSGTSQSGRAQKGPKAA